MQKQFAGGRKSFLTDGVGEIHRQWVFCLNLTLYTKINLKQIIDINIKPVTVKLWGKV